MVILSRVSVFQEVETKTVAGGTCFSGDCGDLGIVFDSSPTDSNSFKSLLINLLGSYYNFIKLSRSCFFFLTVFLQLVLVVFSRLLIGKENS